MRRATLVAVAMGLVSAGLVVGPPSSAAPTTTGLVLNYRFDNDTGVTARDSSTKAINGTYVNTTAAAARSVGPTGQSRAIRLVGSSHQYVAVPERTAIDLDRFTLAAFVNPTGVENDQTGGRWEILEKAGAYWMNLRTDGHLRVGGFFGGCTNPSWTFLDSTVTIPTNTWTHVAGTYNGSVLRIYVNGVRAGSLAVSGTTCHNDRPLAVGAKNYPDAGLLEAFWDGQLDDVRLYRRALSDAEVRGLVAG